MKAFCADCGEPCKVIPLDNSFDYGGSHCTGGVGGTHYPPDYGEPVSDCCESYCYDENGSMIEREDFDDCDWDMAVLDLRYDIFK